MLVSHRAWAMRTPEPKHDGQQFPLRTTWAFIGGEWRNLEHEVSWTKMGDPNACVPNGPAGVMITVFHNKTRKEACLDDVPQEVKRRKKQTERSASSHEVHVVGHDEIASKNKLRKMMEKEVPYDRIAAEQRNAYKEAEEKEWKSWQDYDSCEALTLEQSRQTEKECPERALPSRYVFRNKHAGLKDEKGQDLPLKAKARLCIQGHLCPDSREGNVQVDSPTVERVSTMIFLHLVASMSWTQKLFIGDISNAFLQGAPLEGQKPMYMRQPKQGLRGRVPGQLLRLLKPVYGRPDAPRAWLKNCLVCFSKSWFLSAVLWTLPCLSVPCFGGS